MRKRKVEEHDEGEHEGFDATQLKEHEEFTKVRKGCALSAATSPLMSMSRSGWSDDSACMCR